MGWEEHLTDLRMLCVIRALRDEEINEDTTASKLISHFLEEVYEESVLVPAYCPHVPSPQQHARVCFGLAMRIMTWGLLKPSLFEILIEGSHAESA